ncbi:GNAT family N-acetyltransferase [Kineobactrum sediminis]|nr:GNAT family N-acetyltransferase [Kineobactrum sediminis]
MSIEQVDELTLRVADWQEDLATLRAIREQVFIIEQAVPREIEWDDKDDTAVHILGTLGDEPVACGRLLPDGKIGRMAVLAPYRGRGIGAAVLQALVDEAGKQGLDSVYLHAQAHAGDFYARGGFSTYGEPFLEADIPHIAMRMPLEPGQTPGYVTRISYPQPFSDYAVTLCESANRELCILSPALDHRVFDNTELVSALSALARSTRHARIRILVSDHRPLIQRSNRLLALARRLPSSVILQQLDEHPDWKGETLIIRDRNGVLYKPAESDSAAFYEPDSRAGAERQLLLFDELWRHSAPHIEFRSSLL